MWLGMLAAAAGQLPVVPGRADLLARRAARRLHRPGRGLVRGPVLGPGRAAIGGVAVAGRRLRGARAGRRRWRWPGRARRRAPAARRADPARGRRWRRWSAIAPAAPIAGGALESALRAGLAKPDRDRRSTSARATRSCSSRPTASRCWSTPGRPTPGWPRSSTERGIDRLAALVLTHPDADHSGGAAGAARLDRGRPPRVTPAAPAPLLGVGAGARRRGPSGSAAGATLRSGGLRLRVLWPPGASGERAGRRPRSRTCSRWSSLARCSRLPDAAHRRRRGRARAGPSGRRRRAQGRPPRQRGRRARRRCSPRPSRSWRVISVGADNPYGHPAPATLADPRAGRGRGRCAPTSTARSRSRSAERRVVGRRAADPPERVR